VSEAEKIKIRMLRNVRADVIFGMQLGRPGTILREGKEYPGTTNKHGAICGLCDNGELLGVKPGEFEFVEAPDWVLEIWKKHVG